MSRNTRRGFTLIEMLLAATLSLLALTLLSTTLVPLMRYAAWGTSRAELLQAASLTSTRLVSDLQKAPKEGLGLPVAGSGEPGLLSIHGIGEVTDTGLPVWDSQIIIYDWESQQRSLLRKSWPPGASLIGHSVPIPQDCPLILTPGEVRTVINQPNGTERTLVKGILTAMSLTTSTSSQNTYPLHLKMNFELPVPGRSPETYQLDQDIYSRTGQ